MQLAQITSHMLPLNIIKNSKSESLLGRNNFFQLCYSSSLKRDENVVTLYGAQPALWQDSQ